MSATIEQEKSIHKSSPTIWFTGVLISALLVWMFSPELRYMVSQWDSVEEFSYGYLIPVVVLFLLWQKSDVLARMALVPRCLEARGLDASPAIRDRLAS